jgi:uncharacterized delta-60 repeat protein
MSSAFARFVLGGAALLAAALSQAAATLDPSFGDRGTTTVPFWVRSIVGHADGRMLLAGQSNSYGAVQASSINATRLLASGIRDPDFAYAGYPDSSGHVKDTVGGLVALQPDGRIVLVGQRNENRGYLTTAARFYANGEVDGTFVADGVNALSGSATGVIVQSTGAIVIVVNGSLVRLSPDGAIDATFGTGGVAPLPLNQYPIDIVRRLVRLPDDRLIVLANGNVCTGSIPPGCLPAHLIRLTAEGQLDATFGGTGHVVIPGAFGADLALLSDGRIVVAWNLWTYPQSARLQRLMPDGSVDGSFGRGGIVDLAHAQEAVVGLHLESDGHLVALVQPVNPATGSIALLRWTGDGVPDGRVVPAPPTGSGQVLMVQEDGKRLVAGVYGVTVGSTTTYASYLMRFGAGTMDMAADARLFVAQQYRDFLRREGDAGGIEAWSRLLDTGSISRAAIARAFLDSAEYQGGPFSPITRLYLAMLLRAPDYEGLEFWSEYARSHSLQEVANLMAQSQEFQARYPMGNAEFVDQVYRNVMGRPGDGAGQQYWTGQLDTGTMTRGDVVLAFSGSEEFRRGSESEVFVASVYSAFLKRAPDAAGFAHWLGHLDSGGSRQDLIQAFIDSAEYRFRFMP